MGQGPAAVGVARSYAPDIIVAEDDAIRARSPIRWIVRVTRRTRCTGRHVDIHVAVARPMDELLHLIVAFVGQFTLDAVDARMAVAIGVALCQAKLDIDVGRYIHKARYNLICVRIEFSEIGIQHRHGVMNLRIGDVLLTIVVHHMKHNRNDVKLIVLTSTL